MSNKSPTVTNARGDRAFDCFPAAVLVFVVDEDERILILSNPQSDGGWEVVNGALQHGETILEGALRELREEAGPGVRVRPLGIVHVYTHHYDPNIPNMISICYLMAYEGGEVVPGDDMAGSAVRWASAEDIEDESLRMIAPRQKWLAARAVELYRLWHDQDRPLEKGPDEHGGYKYGKPSRM
jgi:ADP-ribose pyrophosphatase YjhB (NUDIX family)